MTTAQDIGARFRTISSSVPTIPFDAGNVRSVELPRSFLYRNIAVRLTGSLNNTAAVVHNALSPLPLIQKLELVADGRKILWTAAGMDLWELCHLIRGKAPEVNPPPTGIGATQAFSASLVIENSAVRMQFPADSMFDPREYEKIELRVTWGTITNLVTVPANSSVNAATQLDVQIQQTTVGVEHIGFNRVIQFDEQTVPAASSNFTFNVPRAGLLSGILIRSATSSAGIVTPVDSIVNFVTLKSDNSFNHADRLSWNTLKARNVVEFQLDTAAINQTGAALALPALGSNQGFVTGFAYLDLTEDGLLSSTLNTLALNVLQLVFDVNAVANAILRCTYLFYEPIRPLVAASS
jgi:hypothetical protein